MNTASRRPVVLVLLAAACAAPGPGERALAGGGDAAAPGANPPVPATPPRAGPEPPRAALTAEITADEFLARNAFLASDEMQGRESGTPGGAAAEDYVAAELARLGLEPAGEGGTAFQTVTIGARPILADRCTLTIEAQGEAPVLLTPMDGAVPFSFSSEGEAAGDVVFAGYGLVAADVGYDDWKGLDARGKVAIVLRHGPREDQKDSPFFVRRRDRARMEAMSFTTKAKNAAAAGAAALVIVNDQHHKDEALPTGVPGEPAPIPVFTVSRATANVMLKPLGTELMHLEQAIGGDMKPRSQVVPGVRVAARVALGSGTARNVLFARRGTDPELAKERVVVSAHMDHVGLGWFGGIGGKSGQIHNGADDNASGTAALLEIAEHLAAGAASRRTIVFAGWCGEEKGLLGSEWFAAKPTFDLAEVSVNVNLDMLGRYRDTANDDQGLIVVGAPTGTGLLEETDAAAKGAGVKLSYSWEAWEQSDHFSLYMKKVPVLFLHTGLHSDYHRPGDDWWKVNADGAARVSRYTAGLVRRLADAEKRPEFKPRPPRAILGVMPAADDGHGAAIGNVRPGLAAANAGLKAGDVVTELGGAKILKWADLSRALGDHKPGDEVDVAFVRGGKEIRAKVKLSGM